MSAINTPIPTATIPASVRLSFPRVLRSEQIKFFTLRSTWWTLGTMILVCVGLGILAPVFLGYEGGQGALEVSESKGVAIANLVAALTTQLGLLFMVALAVLFITNEYASGMIRSTLVAVPKRLPVLVAKAVIIFLVSFIVMAVIVTVASLSALLLLNGNGYNANFNDPSVWRMLLGAPLFVAGLALIALGIGFMVRSTAAGITAIFALIFVVPIVFQIFAAYGGPQLLVEILPTEAGAQLYAMDPGGPGGYFGGLAILFSWAAVSLICGGFLLKKRDA